MASPPKTCPKCNHPIENETDVVCLECGARLKGAPEKTFRQRKPDTDSKKAAASVHPRPTKTGPSPVFSFFFHFFSVFFLGVTLVFAYAYLFDFKLLYRIPENLASRGRLEIAARVLESYRFLALSRELPETTMRLQQLRLEILASNDPSDGILIPLRIKLMDRFLDSRGILHLKLSVTNASPVPIALDTRFFYVKDGERLLFPLPATPERNLGPVVVAPWKTVLGGLKLPGIPLSLDSEKNFSGKIVFNNGRKYAIRSLKFPIPSERATRSGKWSAR